VFILSSLKINLSIINLSSINNLFLNWLAILSIIDLFIHSLKLIFLFIIFLIKPQPKWLNTTGYKIRDNESLDNNLEILKQLCDEVSNIKPNNNSLIATIRLGDIIECKKQKRNGYQLAQQGGTFYTPGGGTRHILSANEIIKEAKDKNLNEVILVGSKAIGCGNKSVIYLKNIMKIIENNNLKCKWFYSFSPDEDLAFISNAKNIITGPGGFCLVAEAIANYRFNKL